MDKPSAPPWLLKAANEVEVALSPLPEGYWIEILANASGILIACKYPEPGGLGFAITEHEIRDGLHVEQAVANFTGLMIQVETAGKTDGSATDFKQ